MVDLLPCHGASAPAIKHKPTTLESLGVTRELLDAINVKDTLAILSEDRPRIACRSYTMVLCKA